MKRLIKFVACALALSAGLTSCDNSTEPSRPYDAGHKPKNSQLNTSHAWVGKLFGTTGVVEEISEAQGIVFAMSKDNKTVYLCSFTDIMEYDPLAGWYAVETAWGAATPFDYDTTYSPVYDDAGIEIVSYDTVLKGIPVVFDVDGSVNTDKIIAAKGTSTAAGACREYYRAAFPGPASEGRIDLDNDPVAKKWASTKGQWYLPSAEELDALMKNRSKINKTYAKGVEADTVNANQFMAIGGEIGHAYWSSTEFDGQDAWYVLSRVGDGTDFSGNKRYGYLWKNVAKNIFVRPIRKVALQ